MDGGIRRLRALSERWIRAIGREVRAIGHTMAFLSAGIRCEPVESRPAPGTPPGHPEQVRGDLPRSAAEQQLWRQLSDLTTPGGSTDTEARHSEAD